MRVLECQQGIGANLPMENNWMDYNQPNQHQKWPLLDCLCMFEIVTVCTWDCVHNKSGNNWCYPLFFKVAGYSYMRLNYSPHD